jgi:hypothetical protein
MKWRFNALKTSRGLALARVAAPRVDVRSSGSGKTGRFAAASAGTASQL